MDSTTLEFTGEWKWNSSSVMVSSGFKSMWSCLSVTDFVLVLAPSPVVVVAPVILEPVK